MKASERILQLERCKFIFALIVTSIIFIILLRYIASKPSIREKKYPLNQLSLESTTASNKLLNIKSKLKSGNCKFTKTCSVSCNGGILEDAIKRINTLIKQEQRSCSSQKNIKLSIQSITFTNNAIFLGWLRGLAMGVSKLNMDSINFKEVGDSLFSGQPFNKTVLELTLNNIPFKTLAKSMFKGSSISSLEIFYNTMSDGIYIEEDILETSSSQITSISLKYCLTEGESLKNLTGRGSLLKKLQILDLSYNLISKLPKKAFIKAPNLQTLYLISSGINEIELGAFDGLNQIIQLYITNNNLKTLADGTFNDLTGLKSIYISGNPWNCDCKLQWFKDYLSTRTAIDSKLCKVDSGWVSFDEIDFCPSTESTSSETSLSTETNSQEDSFLYEKIWCRNLLMYSPKLDDSANVWYESIFKRRNIKYNFSDLKTNSYVLNITYKIKEKDYLIWTNVKNRSDYGCVFNISQTVLMELEYEKTYTICMASNDSLDAYALIADDCTAVTTPPDWKHRAWIQNYQKITIIVSIVFTYVSTIVITSAIVYFIVKYNPELIKGNKRVLIVKTGSYSPKKFSNKKVSLCTDYEGYLSPKIKNWIGNESNTKYQELGINTAEDNTIYEPPPVPPNHPTKRRDSGRPYFHSNM